MLPLLAAAAITCGYRGWLTTGIGREDAFFYALEAVTLGGRYRESAPWYPNRWLEAARLFGLAFYLVTAWKAYALLLRAQLQDLTAQFARRDLVLVGDHPALAALARRTGEAGRAVLWLGAPAAQPGERNVRRIARPWTARMVSTYRVRRARDVVIAYADDIHALDAVRSIETVVEAGRVTVLTSAADGASALRATGAASRSRIVPLAQPVVRAAVERVPPFLLARDAGQARPHCLILGFGSVGEAVLANVLLATVSTDAGRPRFTILDPYAAQIAATVALHQPELHRSAELRLLDLDHGIDGRFLPVDALRTAAELPFTTAFVCLDDDRRSLSAAAALVRLATRERWPMRALFVHQRGGNGSDRPNGEGECRLIPFGAADDLAQGLGLLDGREDALARRLHDAYRRAAPTSAVANTPWADLPEHLREANRQSLLHLPVKLSIAGVDLATWRDASGVTVGTPALPPQAGKAPLLDRLAAAEHERWMAERRLGGWRYGSARDDALRTHPDLVPFDRLSDASRGYDQVVVRTIVEALGPGVAD